MSILTSTTLLGTGQNLSGSLEVSALGCRDTLAPETTVTDPRLLFTGPSPFGWHRYESFLRCPSQYGWSYGANPLPLYDATGALVAADQKRDRNDARPLVLGTLVHLGLAHHYAHAKARLAETSTDLYEPMEAMTRLAASEVSEAPPPGAATWSECAEVACEVVAKYIARYVSERIKPLHVEEVFVLDVEGAPITMRVDLVAEDSGGRVYFIDHKTTGRITANHARFYGISGQFLAYTYAGRLTYGDRFAGVMLNLLQCGDTIKFERPQMPPAPGLLNAFPATVKRAWGQIQELAGTDPAAWPKHPTEHTCWTRYGPCKHLESCRLGLTQQVSLP